MAPYCSISTYLLLLLTTSTASPLSFNLSPITRDQDSVLRFQGSAYISPEGLQVTTNEKSSNGTQLIGRATYAEPLHLWDKATGNLTDFNTHFSFVIQATGCAADGLAFFLSPLNSTIPAKSSGAGLGLAPWSAAHAPLISQVPFLAVEFDTFSTSEFNDPQGQHVGIDVRSLNSTVYAPWRNNLTEGKTTDAWISYNSSNMKFRVTFNEFNVQPPQLSRIEYTVDLRTILPEFVEIGFSAATGDCFQTNNVRSWSFSSTLDLKIEDTQRNSTGPNPKYRRPPPNKTGPVPEPVGKPVRLIAALSMAAAVGLVLVGYRLWRRKRGGRNGDVEDEDEEEDGDVEDEDEEEDGDVSAMEMDFQKGSGPRRFSYGELAAATGNFAEESKLGEGGFGGVYRGYLKNLDSYIAVKRVSKNSKQGAKEYASEVKIISRLRHRNLVQLIGWCHEKRELLLVYELQPNGSLDSHLFNRKNRPLNWETRFKVTRGLAAALLYLHEECDQCVVHRDIKSSNVMLDSAFNAKLGDFGLARVIDHDKGSQTTIIAGTMGYMAPECMMTGRASKESDVYSFGIVALEISTGRRPISGQVRTVEWVWELYGMGRPLEAADVSLEECGGYDEREMERLMVVGLWCAHPDDGLRPSMKEVVRLLEFEGESPPQLPPKMPVPTYGAPPPPSSVASLIYASNATYSSSGYSHGFNATSSFGASVDASAALLHSR
ncbi:L-type lectin-domain containing receptor kinase IX.1-like [Salvia hispanica]|uniref:L-type lectin-domain containing receptor kinase IX.1-like n=1 Tax=Salvia hispanica TaxID=49212 RepID=UPI0020098AA9|nr:L-type lectin-domain containing receptor kinase IX.1-like [Salvia hispanica]